MEQIPAMSVKGLLLTAYQRMLEYFGPRNWWPADSPLEVMVGAVLTQNTAWTNVEKAIENIKAAGALSIENLNSVQEKTLAEWIRPSGYYNLKAKRLKALLYFIKVIYRGDLNKMKEAPLETLREQLLKVYGIGNETADSILLYALNKPVFVVDAYTHRIFTRHHIIKENTSYEEVQRFFIVNLPRDIQLYNEYHALIVETGKTFCRKKPLCHDCPLSGLNGINAYFSPLSNE
jgi:endonuclease-3 related protein